MAGTKESATVAQAAGRKYWRAAEARVVVEAWRRSGEGLSAFAGRHGIHRGRLRRWAQRLEGDGQAVGFYPVQLMQQQGPAGGGSELIEILLAEGCTVRVPAGFAASDLQRVLAVLAVAS